MAYTPYSLGTLLGILAVVFDLVIAIIAAANVAMASHFSLDPPRKEPNFQGHLLFCMMMQFATAVASAASLLFSIATEDNFFAYLIEMLFLLGSILLLNHVRILFGPFHWEARISKTQLHVASCFLSTALFGLAVVQRSKNTMWLITLSYCLTLIYHFVFFSERLSLNHLDEKITGFSLLLLIPWGITALLNFFFNDRSTITIAVTAASGSEAILLVCIFLVQRRHRRLGYIRVPTEPV